MLHNTSSVQALLLYAAAIRQQADSLVTKTCDSSEEEPEHFVQASKLFQQVAGILNYVVDFILPEKPIDNGTNRYVLCEAHWTSNPLSLIKRSPAWSLQYLPW